MKINTLSLTLFLLLLVSAPLFAADMEEGLSKFFNEMGLVTFFIQEEGWNCKISEWMDVYCSIIK